MDPTVQKGLERVISQRALQMSSSFSCKIWVVGFICGICITYLFMAAITSFLELGVSCGVLCPIPCNLTEFKQGQFCSTFGRKSELQWYTTTYDKKRDFLSIEQQSENPIIVLCLECYFDG